MFHFYKPIINYQREKLQKQSHLQLHPKINKRGISLTEKVKDLYLEKYKTLKKIIEDISKLYSRIFSHMLLKIVKKKPKTWIKFNI